MQDFDFNYWLLDHLSTDGREILIICSALHFVMILIKKLWTLIQDLRVLDTVTYGPARAVIAWRVCQRVIVAGSH